jgi:general secretion pathway protein J
VVLVRPPFRVVFAYAGQDRLWQPTWRGADRLPSAFRVSVRNSATGRILTVSSAGRVHVDAPAACADPKVKDCDDVIKQADAAAAAPKGN